MWSPAPLPSSIEPSITSSRLSVGDADYEKRIKAAYPIHPEIFDRLYTDWSTLVKFQRTRGVLRLMAAVIHSLWEKDDRNPLILPANIAIDDPRVQFELTRYLPDNWVPVIEKDVDGPSSLPLRIEALVHGSRALGEPRSTSWPSWRQQVHDLDMKSRVHPKYKTKYHVGNWPAYDRALVQRGDITVWLAPDAIGHLGGRGRRQTWRAAAVFRSRHRNRADAPAHLPPALAAD